MHNLESFLENEMCDFLRDFEIQTDHLIPDHVIRGRERERERKNFFFLFFFFCCPSAKRETNTWTLPENEGDGNTNCNRNTWNGPQRLGKGTKRVGNWGKNLDSFSHLDSSSSSCHATSTDIPDPLSPLLPIVHRLWRVFRATSHILIEFLYKWSSWSSCFCSAICGGPSWSPEETCCHSHSSESPPANTGMKNSQQT